LETVLASEWTRDEFSISTDPTRLDIDAIHAYLTASYWANGITREMLERSIAHSLPFGVYHGKKQVGFARVITDRTTFAYLSDVFILPEAQGKGLGKWMIDVIVSHPELQGLRRWLLFTRDARGLYEKYGFAEVAGPSLFMERKQKKS
jgi:GNAT superfamily N-acetyltransferase